MEETGRNVVDDAELLRRYLALHQDERCPSCGYGLHRLTTKACPECGTRLQLSVGRREPPLAAWLVMAVTLWVVTGEGLYNVFWVASSVVTGDFSGWEVIDAGIALLTIATIPLAVISLVVRRPFVKLPSEAQWAIAVAVALPAALVVLFSYVYYNFLLL